MPIILYHRVFDIKKMSMEKLEACVQHLHGLQQTNNAKYKATQKIQLEQEAKRKADTEDRCKVAIKRKVEAKAKKTRPSKQVSKPVVVTIEALKVVESTPIPIVEKPKNKVDEAPTEPTSNEAISKDTNVVIVHTTLLRSKGLRMMRLYALCNKLQLLSLVALVNL